MSGAPQPTVQGNGAPDASAANAQQQEYYDPQYYQQYGVPEGAQVYTADDGNQYYYYPDQQQDETFEDYDSGKNPMAELTARAQETRTTSSAAAPAAASGAAAPNTTTAAAPAQAKPSGAAVDVLPSDAMAAVAETLMRTYEYEDWTPHSNGILYDIVNEIFFSKFFRFYFTFEMLCAGSVILFLLTSYIFATLYRLFSPPPPTSTTSTSAFWQSMAYFSIFFAQSFFSVSIGCVWMDMIKGFWGVTRESTSLWGIHLHLFTDPKKPPIFLYILIIGFSTVFPLIWAIIETLAQLETVLHVAQQYFYISVLVVMWFVAFVAAYWWFVAIVEKRNAYARRFKSDDLKEKRTVVKGIVEKEVKGNWYYSESSLEEYGLEKKTIAWSTWVFIGGLVPLFAILAGYSRENRSDFPDNGWVAVGVIFISILLLLFQLTSSKNHAHRTVFISIFLMVLLFIFGLVGCGSSGSGGLFAVLFVLWFASQGLMLRKRQHQLTRKEVCALMQIAIDRDDHEERKENRFDTYMCCCRNTLMAAIQFLDIKTLFGYRHPKVRQFERQIVVERPSLRCDIKVLLLWWLYLFICYIFVVGIGRTQRHDWNSALAARSGVAVTGTAPGTPLCLPKFGSLGTIDLALLATLGDTYGSVGAMSLATWFFHLPNFYREFPVNLPNSLETLSQGNVVPFAAYRDSSTNTSYIVLRQQMTGVQMLQGVDYYGQAAALNVAGVLGPIVSAWGEANRAKFVQGSQFFKKALDNGFDPLAKAHAFAVNQLSKGLNVVFVGKGFNGGYAKVLGSQLGVPSISFNSPGIKLTAGSPVMNGKAVEIHTSRSIYSLLDSKDGDVSNLFEITCDATWNECSDIPIVVKTLITTCGDPYGRSILK